MSDTWSYVNLRYTCQTEERTFLSAGCQCCTVKPPEGLSSWKAVNQDSLSCWTRGDVSLLSTGRGVAEMTSQDPTQNKAEQKRF